MQRIKAQEVRGHLREDCKVAMARRRLVRKAKEKLLPRRYVGTDLGSWAGRQAGQGREGGTEDGAGSQGGGPDSLYDDAL